MRSAQRKARILGKAKKAHIFGLLIKVFIPLILILSVVLYVKLNTRYWNGQDKLSFVFQKASGDVGVTVLDPELSEETTLIIPGDTEVDVARGYGTLRIKNVWQLSQNEHLGGNLLAETVTDNFLFPTNLWTTTDLNNIWAFIFTPKTTNIPLGDRLSAGIFALNVSGIDKTEINLGNSQFLKKQKLTDGQPGYIISGPISARLTIYFADNAFANKNLRFGIIDSSGRFGVADKVGAILEILGGKVVAVDKKPVEDSLDCSVFGQNSDVVKKVARLFSCKTVSGKSDFDLEMKIGAKFTR